MATLRARIEALTETQQKMGEAALAALTDPSRKTELVQMRRRFATEVGEMSAAIDADPQMKADPALCAEFRNRFSQMRAGVAIHQAKWPAVLLDGNSIEFRDSARSLMANNRVFMEWARSVLK